MASIRKEIVVENSPENVWDAIRDVGALHKRLVPGFVTDCRMDGDAARMVTFGNGMTVRELIIDVNDRDFPSLSSLIRAWISPFIVSTTAPPVMSLSVTSPLRL